MIKYVSRLIIIFVCLLLLIIWVVSCENEYPDSLFNPEAPKGDTPEIESISPAEGSLAGVGQVTINGKNFSGTLNDNFVFFNAERAINVEASPNKLVVIAPNLFGDSIKVKIAVHKVELYSDTKFYKLIPAVKVHGELADGDETHGIAVDTENNVFVSASGKIIRKIASDGKTTAYKENLTFLKANNMKMGPGNTLYCTVAAGRVRKIATLDPQGVEGTFVSLTGNPGDLDFDENKNIWVTVLGDIYLVKSDKTAKKILSLPVTLVSLRVFNGYVYVTGSDAGTGEAKIWRMKINGENLDAPEVVLDLTTATWLEGKTVNCLTFSADGEMVLGTNHEKGIFIYRESDKSASPLYPGLIAPSIYAMTWNETHYLYASQQLNDGAKVLAIDMAKAGAPYFGRK